MSTSTFEQAKAFFQSGLGHYQAGRFEAAERDFSAALALVPGRPSTLLNLGATQLALGRPAQALALLEEAIAQVPGDPQALGHAATALAELGRRDEALAMADRALAADARLGPVWGLRGTLLRERGELDAAAQAYEQAIAHGAHPDLHRYYLAGLGRAPAPPTPPAVYVEQLFDSYAGDFDHHLVQVLRYRAPERLVAGLGGRRFAHALDLGCGTGLCGPLLRPLATRLEGVDLSANMVRQAQASGQYDAVVQADVADFLATTPARPDLLVAADVFIYVGALERVFDGAARVLAAGGVFCFSLEATDDPDASRFVLRPSLRYAHGWGYIRMLAEQHGFSVQAHERHVLREDQREPVPGLFGWLTKTLSIAP